MNAITFREEIRPVRTIVVKTGSRILTAEGKDERIARLATDLAALRKAGLRVALVSSGAIAHGMQALGMAKRPSSIPLQQACASIGQNRLMNAYQAHFARHDVLIGQVLLTWDDLRSRKRYLNLRNTLFQLFECGTVPIINENDSVGVEEIRFGTNDILAAQIATLVQADVLVNLTDVGGLYDRNPREHAGAKHIPVVAQMSESVQKLASDKTSEVSVGGMSSKLKSVEMVARAGIFALIGDGFNHRLLEVLSDPNSATLFLPSPHKIASRHHWIAFSGSPQGTIVVDAGAQRAILEKGKSLLPAGIKKSVGSFKTGDNVDLQNENGTVFARGLANFSSDEIVLIAGCKSSAIEKKLGGKQFDEVVHRDNLVIL
jgi:glutamate 5-kinase